MGFFVLFCLCSLLNQAWSDDINNTPFPDDFLFGVATAALQIEGGWDADGKGENIWDHIIHNRPSFIKNNDTADIACDSYNKYKEDVSMMKNLGVTHYRFSLSWSRILPNGLSNKVNEAGVAYYKNLIKELKDANIEPFITLYHWDLPQPLQELGGWPNEEIVDWFADYARVCFNLFGDSVKYWMTFNEAKQTCAYGYGKPSLAPAVSSPGIGDYLCAHNVLKAHAKVWHIYDEEYRSKQNGKVGIVIDSSWFEPASNSTEDEVAAETKRQFVFGWYAHPLFFGDYPQVMKSKVEERSLLQGFSKSRLPTFSGEEIDYIKGTVDFVGLNTYTSSLVQAIADPDKTVSSYDADQEVRAYQPSDWPPTASPSLKVTPWGTRKLLNWIKNTYSNPHIIITENGYCDSDGALDDEIRVNYIRDYLSNIKNAMDIDGVNIFGYTSWSLMDNFEWINGYTQKFGLYYVDFNSPNRTRIAKKSAGYYKKVIESKCLVDTCKK